ncbi:MAG: UDP-N-acetylmuramoyl-tripeptide--D-alanyl-D-alanine ligase [Lachnospiraceae bacterium]|nr:UDP-N-acetylmuramoyl-tripeptide--D-alanyl-D-alanine ligase [Lachnospiraceae bacterium]
METADGVIGVFRFGQGVLLALHIVLPFAAILLGCRHYLHMLQLSSYQFQGFFRYFKTHKPFTVFHAAAFLLLLWAACAGGDPFILRILCVLAVSVWGIVLFRPRPAKKKFVVTLRVGRLIAILALLWLVFLLLTAAAGSRGTGGWAFLHPFFLALLPLFVALANLIALPVEKAVRQWYIDDAKRMLREHSGLRIIGITGSFGKTSVKHYLTTMLAERYAVLMTPGSFNTPMGVVRTIREQLKPTHEIFVCEMGARHVGDIREICDIVHPHDGVLTAIGDQHLETFHTRENIIRTKHELLDAVEEAASGKAPQDMRMEGAAFEADARYLKFINGDDEIIAANRKYADAITYGLQAGCDYRGEILSVGVQGTTFRVTMPAAGAGTSGADAAADGTETAEFTIPLVGQHNVVNAIGAIAVARTLGVPLNKLKMAARRLQPAAHRLEIKKVPYGAILDDAYNSNPAGAEAALGALAAIAQNDGAEPMLKILVTPGMVELGEKQAEYNKAFGAQAAAVCDYILTVGWTNSDAIREGALGAGFSQDRIFMCTALAEAMTKMTALEAGRKRVILMENDLPDDY